MSEIKTPADYAAFLESLRVKTEETCPECKGGKCDYCNAFLPCDYCGGTGKVAQGEILLLKKHWEKIKEIRQRHDEECRLLEGTDYQPSNADVDRADLLCFLENIERRAEANAKPPTLLEDVAAIVDKIKNQGKEIERLKEIEKAARDVCYYQGTEGSAERLEELLEYPV